MDIPGRIPKRLRLPAEEMVEAFMEHEDWPARRFIDELGWPYTVSALQQVRNKMGLNPRPAGSRTEQFGPIGSESHDEFWGKVMNGPVQSLEGDGSRRGHIRGLPRFNSTKPGDWRTV